MDVFVARQPIFDACGQVYGIDFLNTPSDRLEAILTAPECADKRFLAEKIETPEAFEKAKALDFQYFQGYYFERPSIQKGRKLPDSITPYVRLFDELNTDVPDYNAISDIVSGDVSLTYKLLKIVNLKDRLLNEIKSIKQAVAILGLREFRSWVMLAMVQSFGVAEREEIVKLSVVRYRFMKALATDLGDTEDAESYGLLGTLSAMDAIFDMPMPDILKTLPLDAELKHTLLGGETAYSFLFTLCRAYEHASFQEVAELCAPKGINPFRISQLYVNAVQWGEALFYGYQDALLK